LSKAARLERRKHFFFRPPKKTYQRAPPHRARHKHRVQCKPLLRDVGRSAPFFFVAAAPHNQMRPPLPAARLPRAPSRPAPPPVTRRHARPSVRAPASTADATPSPDRSRYHAFELDGCEFLVARADGGVLNVADTYVLDAAAVHADHPPRASNTRPPPGVYAAVPWAQRFHGDTLYRKKPWSKVHKMFLVRARDDGGVGDAVLDLKTIVVLDAETRSVTREDVEDRTTTDDPSRVTLRIR
jgi:hypothetical protein